MLGVDNRRGTLVFPFSSFTSAIGTLPLVCYNEQEICDWLQVKLTSLHFDFIVVYLKKLFIDLKCYSYQIHLFFVLQIFVRRIFVWVVFSIFSLLAMLGLSQLESELSLINTIHMQILKQCSPILSFCQDFRCDFHCVYSIYNYKIVSSTYSKWHRCF